MSFFHLSFISPLLCFCLLALAVTHVALSASLRLCNSLWHLFFHMVYRCTHTHIHIHMYIVYIYYMLTHIYFCMHYSVEPLRGRGRGRSPLAVVCAPSVFCLPASLWHPSSQWAGDSLPLAVLYGKSFSQLEFYLAAWMPPTPYHPSS